MNAPLEHALLAAYYAVLCPLARFGLHRLALLMLMLRMAPRMAPCMAPCMDRASRLGTARVGLGAPERRSTRRMPG
jgi:hypothetical protein